MLKTAKTNRKQVILTNFTMLEGMLLMNLIFSL